MEREKLQNSFNELKLISKHRKREREKHSEREKELVLRCHIMSLAIRILYALCTFYDDTTIIR